jgi:ABC-2 type transport system ATP-binding protein
VLLSSHQIAEVERVADQIAIVHQGKIRLNTSLSDLREEVHEVTFTLSDPLSAIPFLNGPVEVLSQQQVGRQVRWVTRGFDAAAHQAVATHPGIQSIRSRPATLDEIFVACTRGEAPEPAEHEPLLKSNVEGSDTTGRQAS